MNISQYKEMSHRCLLWNTEETFYNNMNLFIFILTILCHITFWIQVYIHKTLRHCSLLWIYNYLILDIISLAQILLEYITRRAEICGIHPFWFDLLCILEAHTNTYTTMVQAFALILTNIYRYRFIVKNKNISARSLVGLVFIHLFIYILPLSVSITQHIFSASRIVNISGLSCNLEFASFIAQLINLLILVILPTCINIPIVLLIIQHVRSSQNAVRSVRHIHRRLTIQFIVLYSIWFLFFLPQVIFLISFRSSVSQRFITRILDITAILSDVLVITLFDRRFIGAWKTSIRRIFEIFKGNHRRVNPVIQRPANIAQVQ